MSEMKRAAFSDKKRLVLGIIKSSILQGDILGDKHSWRVVINFAVKEYL